VPSTTLRSLPLLARGKVRDNYAVGSDRLLMVASDRLSAFDVVMKAPVPGKGRLLTQMALFWFEHLKGIVPNHLTGEAPESVVAPDEVPQVQGRAMLVKRLTPLPCEAVVRGYVAGSGWKEYSKSGTVCGIPLPAGLSPTQPLPAAHLHARHQGRGGRPRREHQLRAVGRQDRCRRAPPKCATPPSACTRRPAPTR
jgi:phosphoribosylaminoimidazole-succinocarboxamide synthase